MNCKDNVDYVAKNSYSFILYTIFCPISSFQSLSQNTFRVLYPNEKESTLHHYAILCVVTGWWPWNTMRVLGV